MILAGGRLLAGNDMPARGRSLGGGIIGFAVTTGYKFHSGIVLYAGGAICDMLAGLYVNPSIVPFLEGLLVQWSTVLALTAICRRGLYAGGPASADAASSVSGESSCRQVIDC